MDISSIGNYNVVANNTQKAAKTSELSMDDFFTLLAAQMQNQNMLNPVEDTQFIAQMAQFSSLQEMQKLANVMQSSIAVSYIGKNVYAARTDESGKLIEQTGIVERVNFTSGQPILIINGVAFDASNIVEVSADAADQVGETGETV